MQSRYYDPETGRFINADGYISTGTGLLGYNMYAYCNNNPVMYVDYSGKGPISLFIVTVITICLIGGMLFSPTTEEIQMISENHYSRNDKNNAETDIEKVIQTYDKQSEDMDEFHEYTTGLQGEEAIYNNKYLSPNGGHYEVIICEPPNAPAYIVNEKVDPINMGTYNYAPNTLPYPIYIISHGVADILPYVFFGNTREDEDGWFKWLIS